MAKSVGSIRLDFVAGIAGLDQVQAKFATAEKDVRGGASRIADSFSAAAIKTATLELRVDTLKRSYANLAATIQGVGVGTAAQYERLEESARKVEIANQLLANSYKAATPARSAIAPKADEGGGFNARFAILGAKDVLEGRMTNAFAEAINEVMRFKGALLGIGVGVVGLVAVGYAVVALKEKLAELEAAPTKVKAAFRDLNDPIRTTNDELAVTNDRLQNQIAKLEGRRQNTLKVALDEARVSADKLAESLGKGLQSLQKLLKEEDVGLFRRFLGEAGTKDIQKEIFGEEKFAGHGGFTGRIEDITARGQERLDAATDEKSKKAAQDQLDGELRYAYDEQIAALRARAKSINDARLEEKKRASRPGSTIAPEQTRDTAVEETTIQGALRYLQAQRRTVGLSRDNLALTDRKETLEASQSNGKPGDVIAEKLKAMRDQLGEVQARLAAVGQTDAFRAQTEGIAAGIKAVDELNKELRQYHQTLDPANEAKVKAIALQIKQTEVESQYQTKLASSDREIANRITSLYLLADAIGKGYEATKKANIETQLAQKFGESYTDSARSADVEQQRQGLRAAYDRDHTNQIAATVDQLKGQIDLEQKLAEAQALGAEATRLVALQHRLDEIAKKGGAKATADLIEKEKELYEAQQVNLSAEQASKLKLKLDSLKAIASAQAQGAEAVRKATLEEKYRELRSQGAKPEVIDLTKRTDEGEHQLAITADAAKRANVYRDQLATIDEQLAATKKLRGTAADQLGVEEAIRELEKQRLETMANQALAVGTLQDGYKAFFTTIASEAEKVGQILNDAMHHAIDRTSDELSKLLTGQKTNWAQAFQSIGQDIVKRELESAIKKGLGAIGDKFPDLLKLKDPKGLDKVKRPTGNPGDLVHVYDHSKESQVPAATPQNVPVRGTFGQGDLGGGIFSLLGSAASAVAAGFLGSHARTDVMTKFIPEGGGKAAGGPIAPGTAYMVGENGPEMIIPNSPSRVVPNHELGGGGDTYTYHIDARGSDVGVTNRIAQAMQVTHQQAVRSALIASAERTKRMPTGAR